MEADRHLRVSRQQVGDHRVVQFFALTFAVAWIAWAAVAMLPDAPVAVRQLLFLPGTVAPGIVALWFAWRAEGVAGTKALVDRIFQWQVGARWYVLAAGYMAAIKLTAAVLHRAGTGGWPTFGSEPWPLMAAAVVFSTPFQAGEEIGWRGYALPRLSARLGVASASVVLGVIVALWHLPLFFIAGTPTTGQSLPVYVAQVTALSVALAWLYVKTNGSLLLVMLMHSAVNNTKDIVPSAVPGAVDPFGLNASLVAWITVAVLWIAAVYFLVRLRRSRFPNPEGDAAE